MASQWTMSSEEGSRCRGAETTAGRWGTLQLMACLRWVLDVDQRNVDVCSRVLLADVCLELALLDVDQRNVDVCSRVLLADVCLELAQESCGEVQEARTVQGLRRWTPLQVEKWATVGAGAVSWLGGG